MVNYLLTRHQIFYADHPELLTPTTIYVQVVKRLLREFDDIFGMAHITGGGIPENLPRCLPKGLKVDVDYNAWTVPEIFKQIQLKGNVEESEMRRVFNLGIGYCVVVPANRMELTMDIIRDEGIECWEIGEVYGMSHITGGGIPENLPRCLPKGLKAHVDWNAWSVPEIFLEIQRQGNMDELEMRKVFNLGIGYCVVVPEEAVKDTQDVISQHQLRSWVIAETK